MFAQGQEAISADVVGDGATALDHLALIDYHAVALDRDIPTVHGDEVPRRMVAAGMRTRILMLTAAGLLDEKAQGLEVGADGQVTQTLRDARDHHATPCAALR